MDHQSGEGNFQEWSSRQGPEGRGRMKSRQPEKICYAGIHAR